MLKWGQERATKVLTAAQASRISVVQQDMLVPAAKLGSFDIVVTMGQVVLTLVIMRVSHVVN